MPPPVKLSLFYDITSPWSWVAFEALRRYKRVWNLQIEYNPTFLGAVIVASKNQAPAAVPNKAKWMIGDLAILGGLYDLKLQLPPGFPWNKEYSTLNVMRFMRVLKEEKPEVVEEATRRFYEELFSQNTPTTSPSFLASLLRDPPLLTASELASIQQKSQTAENKDGLKQDAQQLVEEGGAFGFPWIVVQKEGGEKMSFFGSDRMTSISFWLGAKEYPYIGVDPEGTRSKL